MTHSSISEDNSHDVSVSSALQAAVVQDDTPPQPASGRPEVQSAFPKGVEEHLASVTAAGLEPTQSDLEKCRPAEHAPPDSPIKAQLRKFLAEWDVNSPLFSPNRNKVDHAESIVEKMWGWPSLKEMERAKRDRTEVTTKSFPVDASQMFLIMGKDGADILELSRAYNVHISLKTDPFALHVEGVRTSIKKVAERISTIKKSIIKETFRVPTKAPIPPDLAQRISRLTGALLETLGFKGTVRISAKTARSLEITKRLVARASHELQLERLRERLAYQSPLAVESFAPGSLTPSTYAFYPFLSPHPLPWTMNASATFRMRRVGTWLQQNLDEDIRATNALAGGKGHLLSMSREPIDLQELLLRDLPSNSEDQPPGRRMVKASTGHVLVTTSSAQRASLVPPLTGSHALRELLEWMSVRSASIGFVPSLPARLVHSSPATEKIIHRLVYRAVQPPPAGGAHHARVKKFLSFEVPLLQPRDGLPDAGQSENTPTTESGAAHAAGEVDDWTPSALSSEPECITGIENEIDVMLPDRCAVLSYRYTYLLTRCRPTDMQLSSRSSTLITSGQEPPELGAYMTSLREFLKVVNADGKQPDPPQMFTFGGDTWILHSSASVRRSIEIITVPYGTPAAGEASHAMRVVSESILDLESNQKSTHCENPGGVSYPAATPSHQSPINQ
ncbi:hypothetical protein EVJ58_g7657 [Rhodofomes roseus]|uniref:Uncharacterized protein n=1 Tax=Rhodofomes roseus TaxID=34475 RepID=A0A4Y9Y3B4_9APHY|nr:hypothetical protein EVJ58_g7657 [Rhodofomes roseus]